MPSSVLPIIADKIGRPDPSTMSNSADVPAKVIPDASEVGMVKKPMRRTVLRTATITNDDSCPLPGRQQRRLVARPHFQIERISPTLPARHAPQRTETRSPEPQRVAVATSVVPTGAVVVARVAPRVEEDEDVGAGGAGVRCELVRAVGVGVGRGRLRVEVHAYREDERAERGREVVRREARS
jgi:hypothetical protein